MVMHNSRYLVPNPIPIAILNLWLQFSPDSRFDSDSGNRHHWKWSMWQYSYFISDTYWALDVTFLVWTAILHGDRIEGFAFATTCSLMNIRILHIEGGELSGTIDGKLRHCISLLADLHCVSNAQCKQNLMDLGISDENIFITGCPSYDTILQTGIEKQEDDIRYKNYFYYR